MKTKLILAFVCLLMLATGMRAATPYAVFCKDDKSFRFLTSDTELKVGDILESNGKAITNVFEVDLNQGSALPPWDAFVHRSPDCTKVVFEPSFQNVSPTGTRGWFTNISRLTEIENLEYLNTSNVAYMNAMFCGCYRLSSIDLSKFDTTKVADMSDMFYGCSGLTTLDLSTFDTTNVTEMTYMFDGCSGLTSLDLSKFDTSKVTNLAYMFNGCSGLTSLDLSTFDTSKVTNMAYMFKGCSGLTSLDLSTFDTSKVTNMAYMFSGCSELTLLDLSKFDTSNVIDMNNMFNGCSGLTSLDLSNLDTSKVTNMAYMFSGCSGLTSLDLSSFNSYEVTDMANMFNDCSNISAIYVSEDFMTDKVTSSSDMFSGCSDKLRNWSSVSTDKINANYGPTGYLNFVGAHAVLADGSSVLTFKNGELDYEQPTYYFLNSGDTAPEWSGNEAIKSVVFDETFSTARPNTCYGWFSGCPNLTVINGLGYLNTSKVTDLSGIFDGCSGLRLVDMSQATDDCSALLSQLTENALVYVLESTTVPEGRVNVVVGATCDHFIINYGGSDQNLLSVPYDFTANKVTINRNFEADTPYSLHLPFAMNAIEGGTLYEYTGYTDSTVQFGPVESTEAHTPYMFTPDAELANGIVIDYAVEVKATPDQTEDETDGYIGIYEKKIFTEDDQNSKLYYGWAGNEFRLAGKGASVDACRAYFRLPSAAAANASARISAKFGNGTSGIHSVNSDDNKSETPAYNLNGQRITDSYRGIVIKNGKKILTPAR